MIYSDSKHIAFVDAMKVITIFLVVLGHTTICSPRLIAWIYSFHMPAFFAVYGFTYNSDTHAKRNWLTPRFLLSKAQRLLVPCFFWGLIYATFSFKSIALVLWGSQASLIQAGSLSSLWFLSCMFLTICAFELLMWITSKLRPVTRGVILGTAAVLCFCIGTVIPKMDYGYPWGIDTMFPALSFVIIGYGLRFIIKHFPKLNEENTVVWTIVFLLCGLLTLTFILNLRFTTKNNVDFASRNFGNPVLYLIAAVAGTMMLTALSVLLTQIKALDRLFRLGRYSLAVLILHKPLVLYLSDYLAKQGMNNTWAAIPLALITTGFCFLAAWLLELLAPNIIGINHNNREKITLKK